MNRLDDREIDDYKWGGQKQDVEAVRIFSEGDLFEFLKLKSPKIIALTAPWSGPCRQLIPIMDVLASEYRDKAVVAIVNVDEFPQIPHKYGVRNVPTVMYFDSNGEEFTDKDRDIGLKTKKVYTDKLDSLVALPEQKEDFSDVELFEIVKQRFVTRVRRYVATKGLNSSQIHEGDILEEIFNNPNCFYNLNRFERVSMLIKSDAKPTLRNDMYLKYLNRNIIHAKEGLLQDINPYTKETLEFVAGLQEMETIDVKDSETFKLFSKKAATSYKSKLKTLANVNEDLTILKYMLDIKDEDNEN